PVSRSQLHPRPTLRPYTTLFRSPTGRLNADATAGRDSPFNIVVENRGSAELRNITFSSVAPPNWTVSFSPNRIDRIAPGERKTRSEEHTSELQSRENLVCRLLLE